MKVISLRIEEEVVGKLKEIARERSFRENQDVSFSELIREAIYQVYFEKRKGEVLGGKQTCVSGKVS